MAVPKENERNDLSGRFCCSDEYDRRCNLGAYVPWVLAADIKRRSHSDL